MWAPGSPPIAYPEQMGQGEDVADLGVQSVFAAQPPNRPFNRPRYRWTALTLELTMQQCGTWHPSIQNRFWSNISKTITNLRSWFFDRVL